MVKFRGWTIIPIEVQPPVPDYGSGNWVMIYPVDISTIQNTLVFSMVTGKWISTLKEHQQQQDNRSQNTAKAAADQAAVNIAHVPW